MSENAQEVQALRAELASLKAEVDTCKNESAENAKKIEKIQEELKARGCGSQRICD